MMAVNGKLFSAAIDMGSSYCGIAFSTKDDITKIFVDMIRLGTFVSTRNYTCILFTQEKTFHSFGYAAEQKYSELVEDEMHDNWFFFKRFKEALSNKNVSTILGVFIKYVQSDFY